MLLCIAHDPGARLRDIAASLGITKRSAHSIITGLTRAGYAVKRKDGRCDRYQTEAHRPLREPASCQPGLAALPGTKDSLTDPPGLDTAGQPGAIVTYFAAIYGRPGTQPAAMG